MPPELMTSSINRSGVGGNGNGGPARRPASCAIEVYSDAVNASPCWVKATIMNANDAGTGGLIRSSSG